MWLFILIVSCIIFLFLVLRLVVSAKRANTTVINSSPSSYTNRNTEVKLTETNQEQDVINPKIIINSSIPGLKHLRARAEVARKIIQQFEQQVAIWRNIYANEILQSVLRHFKTLETKYNQLVIVDDYGYEHKEDFYKELDRFASEIVFDKEVKTKVENIMALFAESESAKISQWLFNYMKYNCFKVNDLIECWPNFIIDIRFIWNPCLIFATRFDKSNISSEIISGKIRMNVNFIDDETNIFAQGWVNKENFLHFYNRDAILEDVFFNAHTLCVLLVHEFFAILLNVSQTVNNHTKQNKNRIETPQQYEVRIATGLKQLGFDAKTTKGSGDQGADVLATKNGVSFAIQCKKYSKPVGNKAVQEANAGRDFYKQDYGVVVSNAGFTKSARQVAHACGIILLNDNQLEDLLKYTNL